MDHEILNANLENQIYKKGHLQLAAFFGGPLTIVYIIAENYKQLGHPEKIKKTWIIGICLCIVFLVAVFLLSTTSKTPNIIVPLICILVGTAIMQTWQGAEIKQHIDSGGLIYSMWRALLIGIIGLVITMILILFILFLAITFFGYSPKLE
jgi:ABC-type Fe3+ transport system permease subunit